MISLARVVVLGAGVSGHTAALYLRKRLPRAHEVVVVSPNSQYNWIPSNIWVGVGKMKTDDVVFPLAPIYKKKGITFVQAKAFALWPEGDADDAQPAVEVEHTSAEHAGETEKLRYDYLINATGPKLNFAATPGLGPDDGHTLSVCTPSHATDASAKLDELISQLRDGANKRVVIGVGHGTCTCEGAAFEYTFNVEHELRAAGVRDQVELVYLTNENELGDFGVGGMQFEQNGYRTSSQLWTESLFRERDVKAITGAAVTTIDPGVIHYDQLDGTHNTLEYDFAMLLPPFRGADWKAFDRAGADITDTVFAPERVPQGGRRLHQEALRGVERQGLAPHLPEPDLPERVRRRHRVRATPRHLQAARDARRPRRCPEPAANRNAVRDHGQGRRHERGRHDREGCGPAHPQRVDGRDGGGVRRVGRNGAAVGDGRRDDDESRGSRLGEVSRDGPQPQADVRRARPRGALGEADTAHPVHLQGQGQGRLDLHPRVTDPEGGSDMDNTNERIAQAPLPTRGELRRRRGLVRQLIRFTRINWTMWRLARATHH